MIVTGLHIQAVELIASCLSVLHSSCQDVELPRVSLFMNIRLGVKKAPPVQLQFCFPPRNPFKHEHNKLTSHAKACLSSQRPNPMRATCHVRGGQEDLNYCAHGETSFWVRNRTCNSTAGTCLTPSLMFMNRGHGQNKYRMFKQLAISSTP